MKRLLSKVIRTAYCGAILLLSIPALTEAQTRYQLSPDSWITISGTSTLHDWKINASHFNCNAQILADDGDLQIKSLQLVIPVKNLKSTEGAAMDRNVYKTLKSDQITFTLLSTVKSIKTNTNKYTITGAGNLNMANVNQKVSLQANFINDPQHQVIVQGSVKLKMTDFGMTPPTLFFGTLKTGDEVSISFDLQLVAQ